MADTTYRAMEVRELADEQFTRIVTEKSLDDLPEGDVLIRVLYSSLNYKDALSASGNKGVTREYPHTPGIDAAGIIERSNSDAFDAGEAVIVTSYDLGMNTSGGFGEYISVPADWVVPLPGDLTLREAMIYGTAGFTAALAVHKIQNYGVSPEMGRMVVSGATGGVGSFATAFLNKAGYEVTASTGKSSENKYLRELGATEIIGRDELDDESGKPLLKRRWAGGVDTVGGNTLSTMIRATDHDGVVSCCGNVVTHKLDINVYPFILRGVTLAGIDSGNCKMPLRKKIWQKLAKDWKFHFMEELVKEVTLDELDTEIDRILAGQQRGRVVINLKSD